MRHEAAIRRVGTICDQSGRRVDGGLEIDVVWDRIGAFFASRGCVVAGRPEVDWYREAWDALSEANRSVGETKNPAEAEVVVRLRAIGLVMMYLGIYQAADGSDLGGFFIEHPSIWDYIDEAGIDRDVLTQLACAEGYLDECSSDDDVSDAEHEAAERFASDVVSEEGGIIYRTLESHFGGDIGLFAAIWNSRLWPEDRESLEVAVNSTTPGDGKVDVWNYVSGGMGAWFW